MAGGALNERHSGGHKAGFCTQCGVLCRGTQRSERLDAAREAASSFNSLTSPEMCCVKLTG